MIDRESIKERLTTVVENILDRATSLTDPSVAAAAKALGVELDSLGILRAERAFREAVGSIHTDLDTNIGARSNRRVVRQVERIADALEALGLSPEERRQRLISEREIVTGRWKVSLTLGAESPLRFLERANEVSASCFGAPAVHPYLLAHWERRGELSVGTRRESRGFVGVNGYVPHSLGLTRHEQHTAGCLEVLVSHLAVAHAAYRLATNGDLFHGYAVRSR